MAKFHESRHANDERKKEREKLLKRIKREKIVATQYFIRAHNGRLRINRTNARLRC